MAVAGVYVCLRRAINQPFLGVYLCIVYMCVFVCLWICLCVCMLCICLYVCVFVYLWICLCVREGMCLCLCNCILHKDLRTKNKYLHHIEKKYRSTVC